MEHCTLELPFRCARNAVAAALMHCLDWCLPGQCPVFAPHCSPEDGAVVHLKGPHTIHLTGFLEIEDEDELNELDDLEGADGMMVSSPVWRLAQ